MADTSLHRDKHGFSAQNARSSLRDTSPWRTLTEINSRYPVRKDVNHCEPVYKPIFRRSRHDFGEPLKFQIPNPLDEVYSQAHMLVEEYQKAEPFFNFVNKLSLSALNCAPTVFYETETAPVVHALFQEGRIIKIQLKLVCDFDADWTSTTVMMRVGGRWNSLADCLKTLPPICHDGDPLLGEKGYALQYKWWKSMRKPFKFMDLEPACRDLIVLYALGVTVEPVTVQKTRDGTWEVDTAESQSHIRLPLPPSWKSILCLNRELADIAQDVLWNSTTKRFTAPSTLAAVCRTVISEQHVWLRHMHLQLSTVQLVHLFKVKVAPFDAAYHRAYDQLVHEVDDPALIQNLPSLRTLELEIVTACTPWRRVDLMGERNRVIWCQAGIDFERIPCQKVIMDQIMCFAAEYLQNVSRVRLTGLVKTCVKKKWEALLNGTGYKENEAQFEAWKKEIINIPHHELPLRCWCPEPCADSTHDLDVDDLGPNRQLRTKG